MKAPQKILIIKPSSLGDIVHSLPVLDSLHRCFSEAEIHWVVAKGFEGLLEGHPMITRLWIINKDAWKELGRLKATVGELRRLFRELKAEKFDCVIDLQGLLRSGVIAKATHAAVRIGFHEAREGSRLFYTHTVRGGRDSHAVDRYLKIAGFLGCGIEEVSFPLPPFDEPSQALSVVDGSYAVMVPGARGAAKRWPAERFGRLSALLPVHTVVIGSKGDRGLAEEVVRASGQRAVSLAGKTDLKGLIRVIRGARFMVSNDTGPMHIAAALGVPVFGLFGPTNPKKTGPYGTGHTIIRKELPCAPCYRRSCRTSECLDAITVEEVADSIRRSLEKY